MDTKTIKLKGGDKQKKKNGVNNAHTVLTAAGAATIGAIGGAAVMNSSQETELPTEVDEPAINPGNGEATTAMTDVQEPSDNENITGNTVADNSHEDLTQPHPTDSAAQTTTTQPQTTAHESHEEHEPTPEQIAENIIGNDEIDPYDIDTPGLIAVDGLTTVYNEYGYEVAAAMVHTPDGTQYLLADSDGDGIFEGLYDTSGIFVTMAGANLVQSDLEAMRDQTGGYLAINTNENAYGTTDPTNDITDTETGEHVDIAQYIPGPPEKEDADDLLTDEDVDELLAQLDNGNEPNDDTIVEEDVDNMYDMGANDEMA